MLPEGLPDVRATAHARATGEACKVICCTPPCDSDAVSRCTLLDPPLARCTFHAAWIIT
jgi:hypothetical protein